MRPRIFEDSRALLAAVLLAVVVTAALSGGASAIPAFARKYRMSCTTCHAPAPRLKAYGEDFAGNAFQLDESEEPVRAFHDTGDDLLTLQRDFPIAVRLDAFAHHTYWSQGGESMTDMRTPWGLKLMSGGNISRSIGYYFYFYLSEHGEVAGVEDAYLHFNDLFGTDLDIMAGQFQVSDPLFKRELRLTFEDYQIYRLKVGETPTNLAYDRGLMVIYGAPTGTDVVLEVTNGNGLDESGDDGFFDSDQWKNVMLRLSHGFGPVRVGGFGYTCRSFGENPKSGIRQKNELYYWGVDGTVDVSDILQLNFQYLQRHDENPWFALADEAVEVDTRGGLVELIWAVRGENGRPFVTLLMNMIDSDLDRYDYMSGTLSFSYLLRRNVRLLTEATYEDERERYDFTAGFVSAF